jgi:hypothetical protein
MAEPVLDAPRVVAAVGQGVAAGMPEHVGVDSWLSGLPADSLDVAIDGLCC